MKFFKRISRRLFGEVVNYKPSLHVVFNKYGFSLYKSKQHIVTYLNKEIETIITIDYKKENVVISKDNELLSKICFLPDNEIFVNYWIKKTIESKNI